MNTLISLVIASLLLPSTVSSSEKSFEEVLVDIASTKCENARAKNIDRDFFRKLLAVERASGVPFKYRGMTLAAACNESGYSPVAVGDGGKAIGLLQMWPWWERKYAVDRRDPIASAEFWTKHILSVVPKATKRCGTRKGFVSAWAWVASGPKGWVCREPRHYKRLRIWQRLVRKRLK
jgi:hypothetical protein